jgi:hypothetical protein
MSYQMIELVKQLWAGELPLKRTFWDYAVLYGLSLNLVTHFVFFTLLVNDANTVLVALAFALPIPYNFFVVVAVWQSAERYPGPKKWAELARVGTVFWMVALTLV